MRLRIKVKKSPLLKAFLRLPRETSREIRTEMKHQMVGVQKEAQSHHRYTSRSHMLERSVSQSVTQSGLSGSVYLEPGIAHYGPRIHEGHGRWKPDRFLDAALDKKAPEIERGLTRAIDRAIRKAGF